MTSDVNLTAALKNNILSLKSADKGNAERVKNSSAGLLQAQESTTKTEDSFVAASALNSRASGLTQVLDGLSDSIQTIRNADNGVSEIANLLADANKLLQDARKNGESQEIADQYNEILTQFDDISSDESNAFKGVKLLQGDNLPTYFNEDHSTSLLTQGRILSSNSLGLSQIDFPGSPIESTISSIQSARAEVQDFSSDLNNDLSVIQTRRDFTQNLIGTLTEGADKLSVNNQSAEAASLLALNTKQQLEGSSISLASQSQEQILRFF